MKLSFLREMGTRVLCYIIPCLLEEAAYQTNNQTHAANKTEHKPSSHKSDTSVANFLPRVFSFGMPEYYVGWAIGCATLLQVSIPLIMMLMRVIIGAVVQYWKYVRDGCPLFAKTANEPEVVLHNQSVGMHVQPPGVFDTETNVRAWLKQLDVYLQRSNIRYE